MTGIHPTAVIAPSARLAEDATVGAFCLIHPGAEIGPGVTVGPYSEIGEPSGRPVRLERGCQVTGHCVIGGGVMLGEGVRVHAQAVLGGSAQYPGHEDAPGDTPGEIHVGPRTVLREAVRIHRPTETGRTVIGADCYLMAGSHVDHDCILEDGVKFASNVVLGGSVRVGAAAYLGMGCAVHQRIEIGAHTMIGMTCAVTKHVWPYATLIGHRFARINAVGLARRGWDPAALAGLEATFRAIADDRRAALSCDDPLIRGFAQRHPDDRVYMPDP